MVFGCFLMNVTSSKTQYTLEKEHYNLYVLYLYRPLQEQLHIQSVCLRGRIDLLVISDYLELHIPTTSL